MSEQEKTLHTPGPWEARRTDEGHEILMGSALDDSKPWCLTHHIIEYCHEIDPDEGNPEFADEEREVVANAQLIAAAPDLLAACEALIGADLLPDPGSTNKPELVAATRISQQVRDAIAKAKGQA